MAAPSAPDPSESNIRLTCARAIARWLKTGAFPDRLVEGQGAHRGVIIEVVYGTARRRRSLEWLASRYVRTPPNPEATALLLVGLYELFYMDRTEDFATVHETVSAARRIGGKRLGGFVNAVLRRCLDARDALRGELATQPLGIRESHPDVLVERWVEHFGEQAARQLCEWNNQRPETVLRLRPPATGTADLLGTLAGAGVNAVPRAYGGETCLVLPRGVAPGRLPGYTDGRFAIQDPATLMAVELLDPQPGERVLDACAAPGGKTVMIADRMGGSGEIVAADLHEDRLVRLRENLERMRVEATVVQGDAASPALADTLGPGSFDRVLADVPCTNTGVLRRRPDARWRFSSQRLAALCRVQRAILDQAARLVRPGGTLVYSTCSLEPEENDRLVRDWCAAHDGFELKQCELAVPPDPPHDGAFAAVLVQRD